MAATVYKPSYYFSWPRPTSLVLPVPGILHAQRRRTRRTQLAICFVLEKTSRENLVASVAEEDAEDIAVLPEKLARKKPERATYLGITSIIAMAVYFQFEQGRDVPLSEILGPFASSIGAAVGMEFWARWAHKYLWHASFWHMHESHHKPRESPFELNDMIAVINALPAIGLISYGNSNKGLIPGFCYATGLGITVFGIAYVFFHDGLIHNRFPAGPIANVPYFRKVAAAHQLHHSEKFDGVPYGLFLGPKELEEVGGLEELEKEIERRKNSY